MAGYSHNANCITPLMTSNTAPSPVVVSAGNETSPNNLTFQAFNQSESGDPWYWNSTAATWIKVDLGEGNKAWVSSYTITSNSNNANYPGAPRTFELTGSNDDLTWESLDRRLNETSWGNSEMRTYDVSIVEKAYRYFKLFLSVHEASGYGWMISELELIGGRLALPPPNCLPFRGRTRFINR